MKKMTKEELQKLKEGWGKEKKNWIRVGYSSCGIAAGADEVYNTLREEISKRNINIEIKKCGCVGMCYAEPLVEVNVEGAPRVYYGKVDKDIAAKIVERHVSGKMLLNDRIYDVKVNS
ncbi:MAG: (2Fe-2S) ferredoxin domain-containing protein [Candidatus Omnitrophica bacterium]|nr:(2Fe-2S) ferredoxin domain-containing protein [Candidatus Omnitrophota bacterium]MDD5672234.1 (2Fe-2S) ferredoxin domain-containing protein [Candidatus Omnitrophota bacterium]